MTLSAIAEAIKKVNKFENTNEKYPIKSRAHVEKFYSWHSSENQMVKIFSKLKLLRMRNINKCRPNDSPIINQKGRKYLDT